MTEGNTCYKGGKPGFSDVFGAALRAARQYSLPLTDLWRLLARVEAARGARDAACDAYRQALDGAQDASAIHEQLGHLELASGERVTAVGDWVNDHTHAQQFKARFMRTSAPSSVEGIEEYLASGMIRGIGPV